MAGALRILELEEPLLTEVTYNLNGYQPQTVPVKLVPPEPGDFGSPPRFDPSPVSAELVKARRPAPKKSPAKVAKRPPPPSANNVEPGDGGFAPPPQTSGFAPLRIASRKARCSKKVEP